MSRIAIQRVAEPELTADVTLFRTEDGGRQGPMMPGYGCPVTISQNEPIEGWYALLLLRDEPLQPGETRRLGFVFLSGQRAVEALSTAGRFFLWEGKFIGEAVVVQLR